MDIFDLGQTEVKTLYLRCKGLSEADITHKLGDVVPSTYYGYLGKGLTKLEIPGEDNREKWTEFYNLGFCSLILEFEDENREPIDEL